MPRCVEPLLGDRAAENLDRHVAIGTVKHEWLEAVALARHASSWRTDQNIAAEHRHIGDDYALPPTGRGVPEDERRLRRRRELAGDIGVIAKQRVPARPNYFTGERFGTFQPPFHLTRDRIAGAAADGVVELRADERAPRVAEQRTSVPPVVTRRERGERLRDSRESEFDVGVTALERRASSVDALQGPGVPIRPPQLARERW